MSHVPGRLRPRSRLGGPAFAAALATALAAVVGTGCRRPPAADERPIVVDIGPEPAQVVSEIVRRLADRPSG